MTDNEKKRKSLIKRVLFFLKFLEIRLRFVAILIVTALVVGYWDHIQNYYERWQRERSADTEQTGAARQAPGDTEYFCGMHPFVVRDRPGKCPICGMDLTPRKKGEPLALPEGVLARVQTSPEKIMQAGVRTSPALYRLLARTVRSYGVIEPDETRLKDVVARFPGRVEDLYVDATGQTVAQGQALARIYSPEFLAGSDEYRRALTAYERLEANNEVSAEEKQRAARLVEGARRKLSLAGFTSQQLEAIGAGTSPKSDVTLYSPVGGTVMEKAVLEGQTVMDGTVLYRIADLNTLWVQILVIESDISAVHVGMPVEVTSVSWPGAVFYGTVDFIYPEVNPDNRSVKVRVVVQNHDGKLKPGMYVDAVMRAPVGRYGPADAFELAKTVESASPDTRALPTLPTTTMEDAARYLASLPAGAAYYTCSMDPEVVSDKPGDCPKCGMALMEQAKGSLDDASASATEPATVSLPTTTPTAAEAYLATVPPGGNYYTCTMDPEVVSDRPGDCPLCGMKLVETVKPADMEGPEGGSYERWAEGYACGMHPDELVDQPGICTVCPCEMEMVNLRVERVLSVPESAVIDTGTNKVVYIETEPGLYDAKSVVLGPRSGNYYPVLAGLTLGQKIVTEGSFLIDAEARLNPAAAGAAPQAAPTEDTAASSSHKH